MELLFTDDNIVVAFKFVVFYHNLYYERCERFVCTSIPNTDVQHCYNVDGILLCNLYYC